MKTRQLQRRLLPTPELRKKVLKTIRIPPKGRGWDAARLARHLGVDLEHLEHRLVEMALEGLLRVGRYPEGGLWVRGNR